MYKIKTKQQTISTKSHSTSKRQLNTLTPGLKETYEKKIKDFNRIN